MGLSSKSNNEKAQKLKFTLKFLSARPSKVDWILKFSDKMLPIFIMFVWYFKSWKLVRYTVSNLIDSFSWTQNRAKILSAIVYKYSRQVCVKPHSVIYSFSLKYFVSTSSSMGFVIWNNNETVQNVVIHREILSSLPSKVDLVMNFSTNFH